MNIYEWLQTIVFFVVLLALVKPLGSFMAKVFQGERTFLSPVLAPCEKLIYRISGVKPEDEMGWQRYAGSMLLFNLVLFVGLFVMLLTQHLLPLNPQKVPAFTWQLALNTAVSFVTNTNWQAYVGEQAVSYFTQMVGLAVHNFVSAATGIVIAIAVIRGFVRRKTTMLGNFWVDTTRCTLYILLPISIIFSLVLVSQGVIQNFSAYKSVPLIQSTSYDKPKLDDKGNPIKDAKGNPVTENVIVKEVSIPMGPVASQEAIKEFGTNGGGFFNANSAHPFENPTPLSNFIEIVLSFAIPSGLTYTLGRMTRSQRHGWAVWAAMAFLFLAGITATYWAEAKGNSLLSGADQHATGQQSGGNMEGKEVRFGIANSVLFATVTTDASCGAVNSMHDSFTPLGGMVPLINIMLGEVVFGGVGAGLYGMFVFIVLAVFIAGLMVGRTPEYLGKKIESYDVKMAMLAVLVADLHDSGILRARGGRAVRYRQHYQPWAPRPLADPLCLRLLGRKQRLRVCRHQRKHSLVQHQHSRRPASGPVLHDCAHHGHGRKFGLQEGGSRIRRHFPGDRR